MRSHRTTLTGFARQLRTEATDAELHLWRFLRNRSLFNCKFRRQSPIGPYIADFACIDLRLIIELDGGQHATALEQDEERTAYLRTQGYRVLRFWNNDVLKESGAVLETIRLAIGASATPSP